MTPMDVVSDVADTTFDVVAPVTDVPPSVDSTTLNHASSFGEFSANDSANAAEQAQLSAESTLAATPLLPQDSVTDHILGVESVQVPFISSAMVDVASDISEDESEFEDEDEFIPRGGGSDPGANKKKAPAPPKAVGKPPKTQSSATPQDSTEPGQSAKASQAKSGSKPAPPSASAAHPPLKKS